MFGSFAFRQPTVVIMDPKLVKKLVVKEFDHFTDHQGLVGADPLFDKTLIALNGEKWKSI
jgi:cytochrome P450 family 9